MLAQVHHQLPATIGKLSQQMDRVLDTVCYGTITRISGIMLEAVGLKVSVGAWCNIVIAATGQSIFAEVIGFTNNKTFLMAFQEPSGILPGNTIYYLDSMLRVPVGWGLLGRVLNGLCQPIDGGKPVLAPDYYPLTAGLINPIQRNRITQPIDVGIKAINALLTVGRGQRVGIFAGSGVGKSVLLGMMTRFTAADVVIVGLIGERGREVKEFIEENIGSDNLCKTVIIATPIDTSPMERANGALIATSIAEYFRDQGLHVLLIVDSLTRYAQALRQIYLVLGELPAAKGYSPSVFTKLSQLVERTGNGCGEQGSITSFYTVLTEGDDMNDPIADHARSILDGHFVLSRHLADLGHYPAIDISRSISRVMSTIINPEHAQQVQRFKQLFSAYQQNQELIKMGMYHIGSDKTVDEAIKFYDKMVLFLKQGVKEPTTFADSLTQLNGLFS